MHLQAGRAGIRRSTGNLGLEEMLKLSGSGGFARRRETFGRVSESGGGGMGWRGGRVEPEIRMSWRASVISESGEGSTLTVLPSFSPLPPTLTTTDRTSLCPTLSLPPEPLRTKGGEKGSNHVFHRSSHVVRHIIVTTGNTENSPPYRRVRVKTYIYVCRVE